MPLLTCPPTLLTERHCLPRNRCVRAGIGIRESFNANATSTLLATGILDALSTGILL